MSGRRTDGRYRVLARHYYYQGTCHAPQDGPIRDDYGEVMEWRNEAEALKYIHETIGATERTGIDGDSWQAPGILMCDHGQYAKSDYRVHCVRRAGAPDLSDVTDRELVDEVAARDLAV